jgi:hypothetical protein
MGGYMLGPYICKAPGFEPDEALAQQLAQQYNATVAANYHAATGKQLAEGEWPELQKVFEDAGMHTCYLAGREPSRVMMHSTISGWEYGQPLPYADIGLCWACPTLASLLLSFALGLLCALLAGYAAK